MKRYILFFMAMVCSLPLDADEESTCGTLEWAPYSFKHKPPKNIPWKDIVESTRHRQAFYKPEIDIQALELHAWQHGQTTTNNKSWQRNNVYANRM